MIGFIDNAVNGVLPHLNMWFDIELVSLLLLSCPQTSDQKWHINLVTNCQSQQ
jgi:hypothetical protein